MECIEFNDDSGVSVEDCKNLLETLQNAQLESNRPLRGPFLSQIELNFRYWQTHVDEVRLKRRRAIE